MNDDLQRLEMACRGPVIRLIAHCDENISPENHVMVCLTENSPANQLLVPGKRTKPGTMSVCFMPREPLAKAISAEAGAQFGEQVSKPHPCGHWWILLSTRSQSRFCCTVCDLKIGVES